jgi:hypothetical protein
MKFRKISTRLQHKPNIRSLLQTIRRFAKYDNSVIIKILIYITFSTAILLTGCLNTEGILEIKGKVIDEYSKDQIPGRDIILQGLVKINNSLVPVDAGQFTTDSSGNFTYSLRKIKDAYYYNFNLVGDSSYSFKAIMLGLYELEQNAKYLTFKLSKLVELTFNIQKISKTTFRDTLYLSLKSNGVDFSNIYPYIIENYGITDNSSDFLPGLGLRWIGGDIKSKVKTWVFADKLTKIHWELKRDKLKREFIDTLTCKRDLKHTINFNY